MQQKIVLGVSGGIAAYKACDLASLLTKADYQVTSVLTASATEFVQPLAFKTITYQPCYTDQFNYQEIEPLHLQIAEDADLLLLAPATANLIAKLAHGICDDLLTSLACAFKGQVLLAPAMNTQMWLNPITQANITKLQNTLNYQVVEPVEGLLACRTEGIGKLAPVETIAKKAQQLIESNMVQPRPSQGDLKGLKVLITAGGTREPIDPVRFIGNRSSGKMGIALADEAYARGAEVILICTNSLPAKKNYQVIQVETAQELQAEVDKYFDTSQLLIMAAAVADFKPLQVLKSKVKKNAQDSDWYLPLTRSPDILETLGRVKRQDQTLIGFAAESDNLLENAKQKLKNKKLDLIIANKVGEGLGFGSDFNEVYLISQASQEKPDFIPKDTKSKVSKHIWSYIAEHFV